LGKQGAELPAIVILSRRSLRSDGSGRAARRVALFATQTIARLARFRIKLYLVELWNFQAGIFFDNKHARIRSGPGQ
jgi:hypothetical protein